MLLIVGNGDQVPHHSERFDNIESNDLAECGGDRGVLCRCIREDMGRLFKGLTLNGRPIRNLGQNTLSNPHTSEDSSDSMDTQAYAALAAERFRWIVN